LEDLSSHIGFQRKCSIDLDHPLKGFNRHEFWKEISGQNIVVKFQPHNMNIQHPILRLMHHWIAITLFTRQDIRFGHHVELQLLYAMIKTTKVAPIKEMFKHWLDLFKASTYISYMSLVTHIATNIGALDGQDVVYITMPCIIVNENYLLQGHHLKYNEAGKLVFFFLGYVNEIPLPNPGGSSSLVLVN
jgi:hypothetical protein